ncbi:tRNA (adenosine(37)-N6)-threonylcarbamoyltransferase complex ATPase subunit type 1 TsaE [Palleronia abyssalis]|uniref:tRNA threonylcarbamoyladenosine biosynthesis protein TsaE n=1 Tax=Palleronia abyssalis TaxID=1501240 RepID=A0A2R8BSY5_9RHOB|nr:tRNA (adenosine(37)-N6)-threonylcarbamoyltransferase complex ATPase subunit type 1 TsaE [Palleronia abyssalis]SPJ23196.1 tRNA threonylcarbamoyladenosine biosynthesis protein TsaE [Palleronia abyssalis]
MTDLSIFLPDPQATDALAATLAARLTPGDTVLLAGDLGAGKSHLSRRIIQSLQRPFGRVDDVPSPTYTLIQTYRAGEVEILHADLYRLGDPSELVELGLDEAIGSAICLIEWPDRLDTTPDNALHIQLLPEGGGRRAKLYGSGWPARLEGLVVDA